MMTPWWEPRQHWPNGFKRVARRERRELLEWLQADLTRESKYILKLRYGNDLEFRVIGNLTERTEGAVIKMHDRILDYLWERMAQFSLYENANGTRRPAQRRIGKLKDIL